MPSQLLGQCSPSQSRGQTSPSQLLGLVTIVTTGGPGTIVKYDPRLGIGQLGLVQLAGDASVVGISTGLPGQCSPSQLLGQ